jgi:hypothetical protein
MITRIKFFRSDHSGLVRIACLSFFLSSLLVLCAHAQGQVRKLKWGVFSSHPARQYIQKYPYLVGTDAKMLSLFLDNTEFDAKVFSKVSEFSTYFDKYNRAKNEFEARRLATAIQEKFERRQKELAEIEFFVATLSGSLGTYSFDEHGFPFDVRPLGDYIAVFNAGYQGDFTEQQHERDLTVFPRLIRFDEKEAERIVDKIRGPLRVIVVFKPMGALRDKWYGIFGHLALYGNAIFSVVVNESNEVIAVLPSAKTYSSGPEVPGVEVPKLVKPIQEEDVRVTPGERNVETNVPPPTASDELTGTWTGTGTDNTGPGSMAFTLNQYGGDFTGTSTAVDSASGKSIAGQIAGTKSGSAVFGTITEEYENCTINIEFVARISGSLMTGTYSGTSSCGQRITDGRFTLTKQ